MNETDIASQAWHLSARLDYVEEQLQLLFPNNYVPFATIAAQRAEVGGMPTEVIELARAGKKIAAIAAYRQHTGLGLREAKAAIDAL